MISEFERKHHDLLARLIDQVLRCRSGLIRVPDLADQTGFSRFHLARLFREVTQETLEGFVRRIRLERSAFLLKTSASPIEGIAAECGYANAETFCRAFRSAYAMPPSRFRQAGGSWQLQSPTGLHWNEHYGMDDPAALPGWVELTLSYRPRQPVALWSWRGNYSKIAEAWETLRGHVKGDVPKDRTFVTIYRDNMWNHPSNMTMRAELGWYLLPGEEVPSPMKKFAFRGGMYETTTRLLVRTERNDAWSYVSSQLRPGALSFDEYPAWPLPFEKVLTRIVRGTCEQES